MSRPLLLPFRLAIAQMRVVPGALHSNLERAAQRIAEAAAQGADIILLPECMDLGWTHSSALQYAAPIPDGSTFNFLREAARQHRIHVCAGIVERDGDNCFNSAVFFDPDGSLLLRHRKIHELNIAHHLYQRGNQLSVCETRFGTLGIVICADALIPGNPLMESLGQMGAQFILSPCAWAVPPDHNNQSHPYGDEWRAPYGLISRKYKLWIAAASNVGTLTEGAWNGHPCIGSSLVFNPDGQEALQGPYGQDADALLYLG